MLMWHAGGVQERHPGPASGGYWETTRAADDNGEISEEIPASPGSGVSRAIMAAIAELSEIRKLFDPPAA